MKNWFLLLAMSSSGLFALFDYDQAVAAAQKNDWQKAHEKLTKLVIEQPDNPQLLYDLGVTSYKKNEFDKAKAYFQDVAQNSDSGQLKEQAFFNAGNSAVQLDQLQEALGEYESALKINPENQKAKQNHELVKKMLEQQKQEQEQQQDKQQDKKQDQGKDQQKDQQQQQQNQSQDKDQSGQDKQDQQKDQNEQNESDKNQQQSQEQKEQSQDKTSDEEKKDQQQESDEQKSDKLDQDKDIGAQQKEDKKTPEQEKNDQGTESDKQDDKKDESSEKAEQGKQKEQEKKEQASGKGQEKQMPQQPQELQHEVPQPIGQEAPVDKKSQQILQAVEKADAQWNKLYTQYQVKKGSEDREDQNNW